jgi:hypothetical protein
MIDNIISPQNLGMKFFRTASYDVITEAQITPVIKQEFGLKYLHGSCLVNEVLTDLGYTMNSIEPKFRALLRDKNIGHALELGTGLGTGSILLAHYAYSLKTIDVVPRTEPLDLWAYFGVHKKIEYVVALTDEARREYIDSIAFDFAFIDTNVNYETTKRDFEDVKKCERVLIHDLTHAYNKNFAEEIGAAIEGQFAYWEK